MTEQPGSEEQAVEGQPLNRRRLLYRVIGSVLLLLALLLTVYGLVAYSAWEQGQERVTENERQALEEELNRQLDLAAQDISSGSYVLAVRRLEWVLGQRRDFPGAQELLDEAQAKSTPSPTPTSMPTLTPIAAESAEEEAEQAEFEALQETYELEEWADTLSAVLAFQTAHPSFRRFETDRMLFESYINLGEQFVNGDQVELGLSYFAQAEKLGDLPIEIQDQVTWAELYLLGISYYGVDWETSVYFFRDLCAAAPFFQDACSKFHVGLIAYGDQYAAALDWCPADDLYREALALRSDEELREKVNQASEQCAEATPTATPTLEGEGPADETPTPPPG